MLAGWKVEREMLRIPSTRNAAIIGYRPSEFPAKSIYEIIAMEGGGNKWVENTMALMKKKPRDH
jgi:tRNASer (uridine44-2'-O)-methyltransferase